MKIILQPQGNLDVKVSALLQQKVAALEENYNHCFIDLGLVNTLGHSGVSALFAANQLARKTGKRLSLCNLNESVLYILQISDLESQLEILEADEDVLKLATKIILG